MQADAQGFAGPGEKRADGAFQGHCRTLNFNLDGVDGSVALCIPEETYLAAASALFKRDIGSIEPKVRDMVSELLNISMGLARTNLSDKGFTLSTQIPTVVYPLEESAGLTPVPGLTLPFQCGSQQIELQIGLQRMN